VTYFIPRKRSNPGSTHLARRRGHVMALGAVGAAFMWFLVTPDAHADNTDTLQQYWDDLMSYISPSDSASSAAAVDPTSDLTTLLDTDIISGNAATDTVGSIGDVSSLSAAEELGFFQDYDTVITGASTIYNDVLGTINTTDSTIDAVTGLVHIAAGLAG
jgi:hypothetical protein